MAEVKTAVANDIKMNYAKFGTGKKIFVLLPGLSATDVTPMGEAVEKMYQNYLSEYTFYLFDRKLDMKDGYTTKQMAEDTVAILKELGISKIYLCGVSQGGMIAEYICAYYPEMVNKLVVCSSIIKYTEQFDRIFRKWENYAIEKNSRQLAIDFFEDVYGEATKKAFHDGYYSNLPTYSDYNFERFIICTEAICNFDITKDITKIKCPVFSIGSKTDNVFGYEQAEEIAKILNGKCYIYDTGYGHGVYDEAPDYLNLVFDFLKEE